MKNRLGSIVLCLFLISLLNSCTLYPKYKRENTPTLDDWKVSYEDVEPADQTARFWEIFNDAALNDLVHQALKNNQDIRVAIANVDTFRARLGIVSSKLYPQIEGNASGSKDRVPPILSPQGTPTYLGNAFDFIFNVSYLADFWGEVRSGVTASYHRLKSSQETRKSVVLSIVTTTMTSYFLLRQYDEQLKVSLETIQSRQSSYELALIRYELGLTSKLQVEQALALLEFAKLEEERLRILVGETEDLLSVLIGQPTTSIARGKNIYSFVLPKSIISEIPSSILDQRPDLRQAEDLLIAANADIGVAKAKFFPQFNFTGAWGYQGDQFSSLFKHSTNLWSYGLDIIQEIFTGGRLTSNLKLTEAEKRKALYSYHSSILNAFKEVNDALIRHKYNLQIVDTQVLRVMALKNYLHISLLQYNEGQIDYLTYLDAERDLFNAQLSQVESVANSIISLVDIYKTMGGSWVNTADRIATEVPKKKN